VGMDCLPRTLSRAQVGSATEPPMWILACFQTSSDTFQCVCVLLRSSSSSKPPPSLFSIRSHLSLYICAYIYIYYMISLSIYMHQLSLSIYICAYISHQPSAPLNTVRLFEMRLPPSFTPSLPPSLPPSLLFPFSPPLCLSLHHQTFDSLSSMANIAGHLA